MAATNVPKDKVTRRRRNAPARGEWKPAPGVGWQHGAIPAPPDGLLEASREAWSTWFRAWFAAHWMPEDVPILRQLIRLFDHVERDTAKATDRSELRRALDAWGITPEGQAKRRWTRFAPAAEKAEAKPARESKPASPYAGLRVVG